ncbi:MAG: amidohydrolase family protein [Micrococcales bacterium]|nr:amidohydrolase family protein [Micrococcales bacterium]
MALLLTDVAVLPLHGTQTPCAANHNPEGELLDVLVTDGVVTAVGPALARGGHEIVDGGGVWAIPGIWDQHVHCLQAGADRGRLDVSGTDAPDQLAALIAAEIVRLDRNGAERDAIVSASGYRSATWPRLASVAELDAVSGAHPVIAISSDCHTGWLNSAALRLLDVPPREGVLQEAEWFEVMGRLRDLPAVRAAGEEGLRALVGDLNAMGVIGVVDMEHAAAWRDWPGRVAAGVDTVRVRASVYPERLDEALAAGMSRGTPLDARGLTAMGPLKIISDGSLGTRTAYCFDPYVGAADLTCPRGVLNYSQEELLALATQARGAGLEVALHAIGDAAIAQALDVFGATGAAGSIEHAQLVRWQDVPRMADLGVRASVQPAHLLDDRDLTAACWPGRESRSFALASMADAGVELRFGSDAPVAPADPWLAIAAAIHRSADEREAWHPEQHLRIGAAIAASTDGWGTISPGHPGDIVLLAQDPFGSPSDSTAQMAARVRSTRPLATFLGGRVVHSR